MRRLRSFCRILIAFALLAPAIARAQTDSDEQQEVHATHKHKRRHKKHKGHQGEHDQNDRDDGSGEHRASPPPGNGGGLQGKGSLRPGGGPGGDDQKTLQALQDKHSAAKKALEAKEQAAVRFIQSDGTLSEASRKAQLSSVAKYFQKQREELDSRFQEQEEELGPRPKAAPGGLSKEPQGAPQSPEDAQSENERSAGALGRAAASERDQDRDSSVRETAVAPAVAVSSQTMARAASGPLSAADGRARAFASALYPPYPACSTAGPWAAGVCPSVAAAFNACEQALNRCEVAPVGTCDSNAMSVDCNCQAYASCTQPKGSPQRDVCKKGNPVWTCACPAGSVPDDGTSYCNCPNGKELLVGGSCQQDKCHSPAKIQVAGKCVNLCPNGRTPDSRGLCRGIKIEGSCSVPRGHGGALAFESAAPAEEAVPFAQEATAAPAFFRCFGPCTPGSRFCIGGVGPGGVPIDCPIEKPSERRRKCTAVKEASGESGSIEIDCDLNKKKSRKHCYYECRLGGIVVQVVELPFPTPGKPDSCRETIRHRYKP